MGTKVAKPTRSSELPFAAAEVLRQLGANLRTARVRRNLSREEIAAKIGVGRWVVADAEKGKPTTGIGIYVSLLWAMQLEGQLGAIADPDRGDPEGLALSKIRERQNPRAARKPLDNDF